jgi:tetratricopeptide (TPR) repeat protein
MSAAILVAVALVVASIAAETPQSPSPAKAPSVVPDRGALLQQAEAAQQSGRRDVAMRLFRLAAEHHQSVQAYLELARMQARGGDSTSALASLAKARDLAPNSEDVLAASAQVALSARLPMPAVLTLQSLTRICPTVAQYHYLLGVGLMAIGDMAAADAALKEANRLEPEQPLTLLALGLVLNNRKLYADAKAALARSIELQPDSTEAIAALAEAEAGSGDVEGATIHARRALERAPANATANLVMGLILMDQKNYTGARDALLKAIAADPEAAKVIYQLSLAFARLGDEASARKYVEMYQEKLRNAEERVNALRAGGALPSGRVQPRRVPQ